MRTLIRTMKASKIISKANMNGPRERTTCNTPLTKTANSTNNPLKKFKKFNQKKKSVIAAVVRKLSRSIEPVFNTMAQ